MSEFHPKGDVETVKAISLWQPWASAVAIGAKEYETRSWSTPYRGLLAIHASKRWTRDEAIWLAEFKDMWPDLKWPATGRQDKPLPLGAMLCICELTAIYRTEELWPKIAPLERSFGNYASGRFAWRLKVIEVFPEPIPAQGRQGLFNWTRE